MTRIWLRLRAPFAAYRPLQAGSLRATLPVMPYSAAWGLALNLAGIETRKGVDQTVTGTDPMAPPLRLAIGLPGPAPGVGSLFQQAHSYPVGSSGKDLQEHTHGAKYWITPVRREVLVDLDVVVGVEAADDLLTRLHDGLSGRGAWRRYGLPFAGDNNLLFDRIDLVLNPPPSRWYTPVELSGLPRRGATRLTRAIDRADSSKTVTDLVSPTAEAMESPPNQAWRWTPREPATQ